MRLLHALLSTDWSVCLCIAAVGVPSNPPRALAHQMQQALGLQARPTVVMLVSTITNTLSAVSAVRKSHAD
eukprot:COSAG06_NODE_5872_length_3234_cov_3.348006_3_plen_71_part_00